MLEIALFVLAGSASFLFICFGIMMLKDVAEGR
jgi:hypothetical protein